MHDGADARDPGPRHGQRPSFREVRVDDVRLEQRRASETRRAMRPDVVKRGDCSTEGGHVVRSIGGSLPKLEHVPSSLLLDSAHESVSLSRRSRRDARSETWISSADVQPVITRITRIRHDRTVLASRRNSTVRPKAGPKIDGRLVPEQRSRGVRSACESRIVARPVGGCIGGSEYPNSFEIASRPRGPSAGFRRDVHGFARELRPPRPRRCSPRRRCPT